jgi:hypothetical protein
MEPKVQYRVHKSPPLDRVQSQMNSFHILTLYFKEVHKERNMCIYTRKHTHTHIHIYIYIYREREITTGQKRINNEINK